jgi:archaellum biogenesis ATPase FlaH
MESRLFVITGPKNSGKSLKAKELALGFNDNEISYQLQPFEYISRTLEYFKTITSRKTKILVIDDINDTVFLFGMMMLYKYKRLHFENKKLSIVLVCEPNIDHNKWMDLAVEHKIESSFINL